MTIIGHGLGAADATTGRTGAATFTGPWGRVNRCVYRSGWRACLHSSTLTPPGPGLVCRADHHRCAGGRRRWRRWGGPAGCIAAPVGSAGASHDLRLHSMWAISNAAPSISLVYSCTPHVDSSVTQSDGLCAARTERWAREAVKDPQTLIRMDTCQQFRLRGILSNFLSSRVELCVCLSGWTGRL